MPARSQRIAPLVLTAVFLICPEGLVAQGFGLAENNLDRFQSIRYQNGYTIVPTTGKLVSIKITDDGTVYYICREKTGYAIYHLDIKPIKDLEVRLKEDLEKLTARWEREHPDELLFTKDRYNRAVKRLVRKYSEAVWVRNEIVVGRPGQSLQSKK